MDKYGDRIFQVDLDMFTSEWPADFLDFDVVVSGFAIHHGRTHEQYRSLYRRILEVLVPGGLFINLDHVAGEDPAETVANATNWRQFLDEDGDIDSDRFILGSYAEDTPISLRDHFRLLSEVGFTQVEVPWRKMIFALYQGRR
jgi:tRNA (cmo5U34)-methyltransferase